MDRKRDLTSVDIAALAVELGRYAGARVDKVYRYGEDFLRFRLRDFDRGRIELLVDVGDQKHVRVADPANVPDAPERPPDFAMMLRNRLAGAELAAVEQFEFDRILSLRFEREDDSTTVVAELFGDGNAAVLDSSGEVIDSLETVRLKSRTVAPGAPYEFPEARFDPLGVSQEEFVARMRESDTDLVRTLATVLNFGGLWAEELCTRADVPKTMAIEEASDSEFEALYRVVEELAGRLKTGEFDPRVYYDSGEGDGQGGEPGEQDERGRRRVDVTPVPLEEYADLESEAHDTFNDALDAYYTGLPAEGEAEAGGEGGGAGAAGRQRPDFEEQIERQQRIVDQQEGAIEDFEAEAAATREAAEAIYANYDLVDEVLSTVREARAEDRDWDEIEATLAAGAEQGIPAAEAVVSLDGSEGTVTLDVDDHRVTLDVDHGVEKNADRLYREAKGIEEKKAGAEAALEETRAELAELRERRDAWDAGEEAGGAGTDEPGAGEAEAEPVPEEKGEEPTPVDWLARESIPVRQEEHWYEQFRWFHTSDDFLVIGGRDADQNEALVAKYLETDDRFFHTQAHGGPATILKATGPSEATREDIEIPERSRREAAQFAVSYSTIWKEGKFAADVYEVGPDQVSKSPESGEYLEKGGFAIRGDRTYHENTEVGVAVGIACEPETRVLGGPPSAIEPRVATSIRLEPGRFAQNDAAKKCYREFKDRFADDAFVRKVASPDRIQEFLPPGGSRLLE